MLDDSLDIRQEFYNCINCFTFVSPKITEISMKNIDEVFINGVSSDEFFPLVGECVSDCDNEAVLSQEEEIVPVLPLRNMVLFPGVIMPISVAREKSL